MQNKTLLAALALIFPLSATASESGLPFDDLNPDPIERVHEVDMMEQGKEHYIADELGKIRDNLKEDLVKGLKKRVEEKQEGENLARPKDTTTKPPFADVTDHRLVGSQKKQDFVNHNKSELAAVVVEPGKDGVVRIDGSVPGTYMVQISKGFFNRITTPFDEPVAYTGNDLNIFTEDAGIFVTTLADGAAGVWVTDKAHPNLAVSLLLVPSNVPPRFIDIYYPDDVLNEHKKLENIPPVEELKPLDRAKASRWERQHTSYSDALVSLVDTLASNEIPDGYKMSVINQREATAVCGSEDLIGELAQRIEGEQFYVDVFVVENVGQYPLMVEESKCYMSGVSAISFNPTVRIEPGYKHEMFVVYNKLTKEPATKKKNARPALFGGN